MRRIELPMDSVIFFTWNCKFRCFSLSKWIRIETLFILFRERYESYFVLSNLELERKMDLSIG